jgi:hypothetical protein
VNGINSFPFVIWTVFFDIFQEINYEVVSESSQTVIVVAASMEEDKREGGSVNTRCPSKSVFFDFMLCFICNG